jgi:bifunctional DNase/RNase
MPDELTEMVVESVRVHGPSGRHVVILKDAEHERYLPIWIGPWEASAIASSLQGLTPERPLTHDLFATALEELGVRLERVVIVELAEETFHARLYLAWHERHRDRLATVGRPRAARTEAAFRRRRPARAGEVRPGDARKLPRGIRSRRR